MVIKRLILLLIIYCFCHNNIFSQTIEEIIQEAERINTPEGYLYAGGYCIRDGQDKSGFRMYQKAAEMGSRDAMFLVSDCYFRGLYTKRDDEQAEQQHASRYVPCQPRIVRLLNALRKKQSPCYGRGGFGGGRGGFGGDRGPRRETRW